jgi:hypothetical protein
VIGVFSDSHGDLQAFDAAYELLKSKGARRFFLLGARYTDLDEWILMRKQKARGNRSYNDGDFLADVSNWLTSQQQVERGPAFGIAGALQETAPADDDLAKVKDRFLRTPERDSLQYLDPTIDKKTVDMIGNHLCTLVHDKNDLIKDDLLNATVFIHGRDPEPKVVQIGPRFFITPGKLTGAAEQTCALLKPVDKNLEFSAFRLDGHVLVNGQLLQLGAKTKLSVK